ncbi:MAG: hypothetical protein IKY20_00950 [Alistipes sp.]|nr:hypothetical protein [Alistipes sp.]
MKNLKASEAVDGSVNLEILRYTQDDRARDCHEPNGSRNDGLWRQPRNDVADKRPQTEK